MPTAWYLEANIGPQYSMTGNETSEKLLVTA